MLKSKIAEQERKSRPTLLSELVGKGSDSGKPNIMKVFADAAKPFAKKIQIPGGGEDYTITENDLPQIQKFMELQKVLHGPLQWAQYQDNQLTLQNAPKERAKLKTPAEQMAFDENMDKIKTQNASILTEFGKKENNVQFGKPGDVPFVNGVPGEAIPKEPDEWVSTTVKMGGKDVRIRTNVRTGKEEQVSTGPNPGTTVNVGTDKANIEVIKSVIKELPDLKKGANDALVNLDRIDRMNALLDKGLGGKTGQVKAWLAPYAESLGINVKSLDDAQTYELLAKTLGGSMRMQIIGPGSVSDYEQKLLGSISAGGNAATGAARELLKFYRKSAIDKINSYNDSVDSLGTDAPATARVYKKISVTAPKPEAEAPRFKIIKVE